MKSQIVFLSFLLLTTSAFAQEAFFDEQTDITVSTAEQTTADLTSVNAAPAVQITAQKCISNRGLTLSTPEIAGGILVGAVQLSRNSTTLLSVASADVNDFAIDANSAFTFTSKNAKGAQVLSVSGSKDALGRYNIILRRPNAGLIGFVCGAVSK